MEMSVCIWCRSATHNEPVEHILPHGLVGEGRFTVSVGSADDVCLVLKNDEVCSVCNIKRLGPLDGYLQKQLGFFKVFLNRTGTKHGNAAKVEKPGIYAVHRSDGPHIYLNGETKKIITEEGIVIQPAKNHPEAVRVTGFDKVGSIAELKFTSTIRFSKWFFRALYKIAFEMLCFQQGAAFVLDQRFDPIRDYVLRGKGSRQIFVSHEASAGEWEKPGVTMHKMPGSGEWTELRLGPTFLVDLSPEGHFGGSIGRELEEKGFVRLSDKSGVVRQDTKEAEIEPKS